MDTKDKIKDAADFALLLKEIENDSRISLAVPAKLTNPDSLIIQAKAELSDRAFSEYHRKENIINSWDCLKINVTIKNLGRALRFMNTLIKALKVRGHKIKIENRATYVVIGEEEIQISCREKSKRIVVSNKYGNSSELQATGILTFNIEGFYATKEWKDGKEKLEEQIPKILAKLEGERRRVQSEYYSKQREIIENEIRLEEEDKEKKKQEIQDFKNLLSDSQRFKESIVLREYIDAVETKALSLGELTEELGGWINWAKNQADIHDPTIASTEQTI